MIWDGRCLKKKQQKKTLKVPVEVLLVLAWLTLVTVICWTSNTCHFFAKSTWNQFLVRMYEGFRHVLICRLQGGLILTCLCSQ